MSVDKLSVREKEELLRLAREALESHVLRGIKLRKQPSSPALSEPRAAFVGLHVGKHLRGCVGSFDATRPLYETVVEMTQAAASHDQRFSPVSAAEISKIEIEISVLGPFLTVTDPSEITIGRHGLVITQGRRRGVLLPQVATEYGWNVSEFLRQTCRKAGIAEDAWSQPDTTIQMFTAQVFSESRTRI